MKTVDEVIAYLEASLALFEDDPADTDYQQGYQAAIEDLKDYVN